MKKNEQKIDFKKAKSYVKNIRSIVDPNVGFEYELDKYFNDCIAFQNNNLNKEIKNDI